MERKTKIIIAVCSVLVLILLIVGIYAALYSYTLSKVELRRTRMTNMQFSKTGFTIDGEIDLYNGGFMQLDVEDIEYEISLDTSGNMLTSGKIAGKPLVPKDTVTFPFTKEVKWVPTAELAMELVQSDEVYVKISGTASVESLEIPFSKRIDIKPYVNQFVQTKMEEVVDVIETQVGDIGELREDFNMLKQTAKEEIGALFG